MADEKSKNISTVTGTVVEALPNTLFRVVLDDDSPQDSSEQGGSVDSASSEQKEILAMLAGKMRLYRIRVLVGDRVEVELNPYGGRGRIRKRL